MIQNKELQSFIDLLVISSRMRQALELAHSAHLHQRYGLGPYTDHLKSVVQSLVHELDVRDEDVIIAGYLHDTIEDTSTTYQDLLGQFGPRVAEIVYCVTDETGRDREERHRKTYPKLRGGVPEALLVKLADRISNVRACLADLPGEDSLIVLREAFGIDQPQRARKKLQMYVDEYAGFQEALRARQSVGRPKKDLEAEEGAWNLLDSLTDLAKRRLA